MSNMEKADMLVECFQDVHRSECAGQERSMRRAEVLTANQWKLERRQENDSPINVNFSTKELMEAVRVKHVPWAG